MESKPINLLEKNIDKIDWECLSSNPNAIHLLERNLDKASRLKDPFLAPSVESIEILKIELLFDLINAS